MTQTTTQRPPRPEPTYTFSADARDAARRCRSYTAEQLARQPRTTLTAEATRLGVQNVDGLTKQGLAAAIVNCAQVVATQSDTERDACRSSEEGRRWHFFEKINQLLTAARGAHTQALDKLNTPERIGDEHYVEQLLEAGRKIRTFAWIVQAETTDSWPVATMAELAKALTDDTLRKARYGSRRSSSPVRNLAEEIDMQAMAAAAELAREYAG